MSHQFVDVCLFLSLFSIFNPCMDVLLDDKLHKCHQLLYTMSPVTPCMPLESPWQCDHHLHHSPPTMMYSFSLMGFFGLAQGKHVMINHIEMWRILTLPNLLMWSEMVLALMYLWTCSPPLSILSQLYTALPEFPTVPKQSFLCAPEKPRWPMSHIMNFSYYTYNLITLQTIRFLHNDPPKRSNSYLV